jgi:hypothetical protein
MIVDLTAQKQTRCPGTNEGAPFFAAFAKSGNPCRRPDCRFRKPVLILRHCISTCHSEQAQPREPALTIPLSFRTGVSPGGICYTCRPSQCRVARTLLSAKGGRLAQRFAFSAKAGAFSFMARPNHPARGSARTAGTHAAWPTFLLLLPWINSHRRWGSWIQMSPHPRCEEKSCDRRAFPKRKNGTATSNNPRF